jgi:hypothetical protein
MLNRLAPWRLLTGVGMYGIYYATLRVWRLTLVVRAAGYRTSWMDLELPDLDPDRDALIREAMGQLVEKLHAAH